MDRQTAGAGTPTLWFNPPDDRQSGRRPLTRERVASEALAVIAADGAQSLTMRALATRLGVVPGALYPHVNAKQQLHYPIPPPVLSEADYRTDPTAPRP